MALMYADGAMFLGNGVGTNEQTSLIGTTIRTHVSAIAGTLAISRAAAADVKLTTDITFLTTTGVLSILPSNDTVLTTSITAATLAVDEIVSINPNRALLTISITEGLKESAIKDITPTLAIIDSTDTFVETRTDTEVI